MAVHYISDSKQGTKEWLSLRGKYITGTDAYTLLKGKTKEEILKAKNGPITFHGNYWTKRGHVLENEGISLYERLRGVKVDHCEIMLNDDYPDIAGSPDGLIGKNGILEHKAFKEENHLKSYKDLPPQIYCQINWYMWVSNRKWTDMVFYNPDMKDLSKSLLIKRYPRDDKLIDRFKEILGYETCKQKKV